MKNDLSRTNNIVAWILLAILSTCAIPFGSNRPFFWAFWASIVGIILLAILTYVRRKSIQPRIPLENYRFLLAVALCYALFILLQIMPLGRVLGPFHFHLGDGSVFTSQRLSLAPGDSWYALLRWGTYVCLFFLAAQVAVSHFRSRFMLDAICVIVAFNAVYGLAALTILGDTILFSEKWAYQGAATGFFVNRNSFATFLGLGAITCTALIAHDLNIRRDPERNRMTDYNVFIPLARNSACLLSILAALFATQSRMGVAATMLGISCVLWLLLRDFPRQRWIAATILALTAVAVIVFRGGFADRLFRVEHDFAARLALYEQVIDMIFRRPLFGYGASSFEQVYPLFHRPPVSTALIWDSTHSTYLALFQGTGLFAGLLPLLLVLIVFMRIASHIRTTNEPAIACYAAIGATVTVATHSLVDFSLEIEAVAMLYTVLLALGVAPSFQGDKGRSNAAMRGTSHNIVRVR